MSGATRRYISEFGVGLPLKMISTIYDVLATTLNPVYSDASQIFRENTSGGLEIVKQNEADFYSHV